MNWDLDKLLGLVGLARIDRTWDGSKYDMALPKTESKRSSKEESATGIPNTNFSFGALDPYFPQEAWNFLTNLSIINPDHNHATTNLVNLANNGHSLVVDAPNDSIAARAMERLNLQAASLYQRSAGVDGLINHYIRQIAVTGAISSEDVVDSRIQGVERVAIVPVKNIRFKLEDGNYNPYQLLLDGSMIPLNETTYKYYAFQVLENSPYAIPLYIASLKAVINQNDMSDNIRFVMRKFGLLGLAALTLRPMPKGASEMAKEYEDRKQTYLSRVLDAVSKNWHKGLMVKFDDQILEHFNITGEARGARDIWDLNEEQLASGMGLDPIVLGRAFHATETFANVTYMFMIRQANNIRRLPKRRMEATYNLDLQLQGIPATVSLQFADNPARDPQAESQAELNRVQTILNKVRAGVIDPDTAAQEMGYDAWFDVSRLDGVTPAAPAEQPLQRRMSYRLKFNDKGQRYDFVRPRVELFTARVKKELASDETVKRVMNKWSSKYQKAINKYLDKSGAEASEVLRSFIQRSEYTSFTNADDFANQAYTLLSEIYVDAFKSAEAGTTIREAVKDVYQYYRVEDRAAFIKKTTVDFVFSRKDERTAAFAAKIDRFYMGKYIYNEPTQNSCLKFLKDEFLEKGGDIFNRADTRVLDEFIGLASDRLDELSQYEASRIINTSVQRLRTWGNVGQMAEAGFEWAEVYNPAPEAEICQEMNGKFIPVASLAEGVDKLSNMSTEEFEAWVSQDVTFDSLSAKGFDQAAADGEGMPPYHPNCKTRLIASETGPEN